MAVCAGNPPNSASLQSRKLRAFSPAQKRAYFKGGSEQLCDCGAARLCESGTSVQRSPATLRHRARRSCTSGRVFHSYGEGQKARKDGVV
ncbi:hypothetical protein PDJAM_G00230290 [Pangasius djambal]|uniref:Uncharacterized protein n=1 Tax=Pangasius djambal TaxID=1691987 RepID=A0ACC5YE91_9TELE|nr:hypothetical protein [Pangasius djambal]